MDRNLLFLHLHRSVINWVINLHNCSLQNTKKAVLINKETLTQVIPMVSEVLSGMDSGAVNQVLLHLLHFSGGTEEEPRGGAWAAAALHPNFSTTFPASLK